MGHLTAWAGLPTSAAVNITGLASCPKFFVSTTQPDGTALAGLVADELGAGWPSVVVDRANVRRTQQIKMWYGDNGVVLGSTPHKDIFSQDALWLSRALKPREVSSMVRYDLNYGWNYRVGRPPPPDRTNITNTDEANMTDHLRVSLANAAAFARLCVDRDDLIAVDYSLVSVGSGTGPHIAAHMSAVCAQIDAKIDPAYLVVAFGYGVDPGGASKTYAIVRFLRPADHPEVDCIGYVNANRTYATSSCDFDNGCDAIPFYIRMHDSRFVLANELGCKIVTKSLATVASEARGTYLNAPPTGPYTSVEIVLEPSITQPSLTAVDPPLSSIGTRFGVGVSSSGLFSQDVFHIGDPEFVNRSIFVGPTVYNGASATCACEFAALEWAGQRLIDMTPDMSAEDRAALADKTFISTIDVHPNTSNMDLTMLSMYGDLSDAGDVATMEFMPATADHAQVTFGEAIRRANLNPKVLFHQMLGFAMTNPNEFMAVEIAGDQALNNWTYLGIKSDGHDQWITADDALFYISRGARVVDRATHDVGEVCQFAFGVAEVDIRANAGKTTAKDHFDEAKAFEGKLPVPRLLADDRRTAQWMMQSTLNRKQMSSFVIGGMSMATIARKRVV